MSTTREDDRLISVEVPKTPRSADEILAARTVFAPHYLYLINELEVLGITDAWLNGLDATMHRRIQTALGDDLYQGRDEGLGFALGENNLVVRDLKDYSYEAALRRIRRGDTSTIRVRPPEEIQAVRSGIRPTGRHFKLQLGAQELAPGWMEGLDRALQTRILTLTEKARFQGRSEAFGFALGLENKLAQNVGSGKPAIPRQRRPSK